MSNGVTTDQEVTNGLFKTKLSIDDVDISKVGSYRCEFKFSDEEIYKDSTNLKVRIVTRDPTEDTIYIHSNGEFKLTCLMASGSEDNPTEVAWGQPTGVSGTAEQSESNKKSVLTVANPTSSHSGLYSCTFEFADGDPVQATFDDVKVELISMLTKDTLFSTAGGTVLTLTCEVASAAEKAIKWFDGTDSHEPTSNNFVNGKTVSTLELTITDENDAKTYTCRILATEFSPDTATVSVLDLDRLFSDETFASQAEVASLVCEADYSNQLANPTISWKEGDNAVVESVSAAANDKGDKWVSTLELTVSSDSDGKKYACSADYTGIAASKQLTVTATTIVVQSKILFIFI